MSDAVYEHHPYENPQLPFLCHRDKIRRTDFFTLHWHEHLEFLHGLSGSAQVGVLHHPLEVGNVVVVNSGEPHNVCSATESVYDCLIVNAAFCRENGLDAEAMYFSPSIADPEAGRLHAEACAALRAVGPLQVLRARMAVLRFLLYLCEHHTSDRQLYADNTSSDAIKKAVRYIRRHYSQPITLDDAAAAAGLSRYYFTREFRRVTGQSFVQYLNALRCEKAIPLLHSGHSVTEVCYACGFRDLAYFSRTFSKITGQAPSSLRRMPSSVT